MQRIVLLLGCLLFTGCASPFVGNWTGKAPPEGMPADAKTLNLKVEPESTWTVTIFHENGLPLASRHGAWVTTDDRTIDLRVDGSRVGTAQAIDGSLVLRLDGDQYVQMKRK